MNGTTNVNFAELLQWIAIIIVVALALAAALLAYVLWRVRRVNLAPGADSITTLRATPLSVVILLDLLDWSLDVFSAPLSWIILGRLGLGGLRGIAVVEDLIPGTQFLPVMTLAWLFARWFAPKYETYAQRTKLIRAKQ